MPAKVTEWRGMDKFLDHLEKYASGKTTRVILEDLGKMGVTDSQSAIARNEIKPKTSAESLAGRLTSGRGTLVRKKGRSKRVRRISRKAGPARQGITLLDTGLGMRRIQYRVTRDTVAVGVDGYMSYHQDGTLDGVLPARPFLKLPTEQEAIDTVEKHWRKIK